MQHGLVPLRIIDECWQMLLTRYGIYMLINCAYTAIPDNCLAIPTSTYMYFVIICALETAWDLCVQAIRHIGKTRAMTPMIVDQAKSTKRWVIFKNLTYLYQYCLFIFWLKCQL